MTDSFRTDVQHSRLYYRRQLAQRLAVAAIQKLGGVDTSKVVTYADEIATKLATLEQAELAKEEIPT